MKQIMLSFAMVSLVGLPTLYAAGGLQSSKRTPSSTPATQAAQPARAAKARTAKGTTHLVSAEFVAYDAGTKTITVKDEKGETSTAPLEGKAIGAIARLKKGDQVMLTYRDNAKGEHQAVTNINPAKRKG